MPSIDPLLYIDWFLLLYFVGVGFFYAVRVPLAGRRHKVLFVGIAGSRHWLGHMAFRLFRICILMVCIIRPFQPGIDPWLVVVPELRILWLNLSGVMMMLGGFVLALCGHFNLGGNWRSGIDPRGPAQLITGRLYRFSRNPMYSGVIAAQLGFVLALPSLFSLICLIAGVCAIFNQVSLEEAHLKRQFPVSYPQYSMQVPRWFSLRKTLHNQ